MMSKFIIRDNVSGQYISLVNKKEPQSFKTLEAAQNWIDRLHITQRFTIYEIED